VCVAFQRALAFFIDSFETGDSVRLTATAG
jgi:hypothetical protein